MMDTINAIGCNHFSQVMKGPAMNHIDQGRHTIWIRCFDFCRKLFLGIAIAAACSSCGPETKIEGDTVKIHYRVASDQTAGFAALQIAPLIWTSAKSHPEAKKIEVTLELTGDKVVDNYGKELPGPYIMGTITKKESGLDEVRKYADEKTYAVRVVDQMTLEIQSLEYGNLLLHQ
jgi:hypothetical protein